MKRMRKPLNDVSAELIGRISGRPANDPVTRLRALSLFGQITVFHIAQRSALQLLEWEAFEGERAELLIDTIAEQTRVLLSNGTCSATHWRPNLKPARRSRVRRRNARRRRGVDARRARPRRGASPPRVERGAPSAPAGQPGLRSVAAGDGGGPSSAHGCCRRGCRFVIDHRPRSVRVRNDAALRIGDPDAAFAERLRDPPVEFAARPARRVRALHLSGQRERRAVDPLVDTPVAEVRQDAVAVLRIVARPHRSPSASRRAIDILAVGNADLHGRVAEARFVLLTVVTELNGIVYNDPSPARSRGAGSTGIRRCPTRGERDPVAHLRVFHQQERSR